MRMIALLRGVNVGGVKIRMSELAELFQTLGFTNVTTVLASGNVVFDTDAAVTTLKSTIEAALEERFGYDAWVHVLTTKRMAEIVDAFPFDEKREGWHPYVIFTTSADARAELLSLKSSLDSTEESIAPGDGVVYWGVEVGNTLSSVIGKTSAKARFKTTTTTRNLRTLRKLR